MTEFKKVFIDTAPFIYYLEDNVDFAEIVERFFQHCLDQNTLITTSVISVMEFAVKPYQLGKSEIVEEFKDFLIELGIKVYSPNILIAEEAARLRARYKSLKGMDALQLAIAIIYKCSHFVTNDKQLQQVNEIEVITIDGLNAIL